MFVSYLLFFFFKQKTAYEMRISDWSSDVCSSDLPEVADALALAAAHHHGAGPLVVHRDREERVALVVAEADVEARLVLLDQRVLEHQRFDVVADLDPLDGLCCGHHLRGAGRQRRRLHEVVRSTLAQRARLAAGDDAAVPVLELEIGRGSWGERGVKRG